MEFIELFTNILTILFLIVLLNRSSGYGKHTDKEDTNDMLKKGG